MKMGKKIVPKSQVCFYHLPDMQYVRPVCGVGVGSDFARHRHNSMCVGIVDRGTRLIRIEGRDACLIRPGQAFVINPGQAHACSSVQNFPGRADMSSGHDYRILSIDSGFVRDFVSDLAYSVEALPFFDQPKIGDQKLVRALNLFFDAMQEIPDLMAREQALNDVLGCLLRLSKSAGGPAFLKGTQTKAVTRAKEYIEAHFNRNICLWELADIAGLSQFHLQRVFFAQVGVSPREYLLHCRACRAAELVGKGYNLADTAAALGFADQSHFTKVFKRFVGVTPGRVRYCSGF